jgi:hypothetical protein
VEAILHLPPAETGFHYGRCGSIHVVGDNDILAEHHALSLYGYHIFSKLITKPSAVSENSRA